MRLEKGVTGGENWISEKNQNKRLQIGLNGILVGDPKNENMNWAY